MWEELEGKFMVDFATMTETQIGAAAICVKVHRMEEGKL